MFKNVNQHKNHELVTNSQVLYLNSDEFKIYNYLQKKGSASVAELELIGVNNPRGVVYKLRCMGLPIITEYHKAEVKFRNFIKYGHWRYHLGKEVPLKKKSFFG